MVSRLGFQFGRKKGPMRLGVPHWSAVRMSLGAPDLPPLVAQADYTQGIAAWGALGNDTVGDCTCAAFYHARQIWALGTGAATVSTVLALDAGGADALQLYTNVSGYNPNGPVDATGHNTTDNGAYESDVLAYVTNTGAPVGNAGQVDKLLAYVQIDLRQQDDLRYAIWQCGVAYIAFQCPTSWNNVDYSTLATWDAPADGSDPPDPNEGHAVVLVAFGNGVFKAISWGNVYAVTPAFVSTYVDEAYALADQSWITGPGSGNTPLGLSAAQLQQLMGALK